MPHLLEEMRPEAPMSTTTRDYAKELWQVTTTCLENDPIKQPTADNVLDALWGAAVQWELKRTLATLFPLDDWRLTLTLDEVVDRILARAKSPLGNGDAREVVEALEKVSVFYPRIGVSNQRTTDATAPLPNEPAYEEAMFLGTREDLWGIRYPPRLAYHP